MGGDSASRWETSSGHRRLDVASRARARRATPAGSSALRHQRPPLPGSPLRHRRRLGRRRLPTEHGDERREALDVAYVPRLELLRPALRDGLGPHLGHGVHVAEVDHGDAERRVVAEGAVVGEEQGGAHEDVVALLSEVPQEGSGEGVRLADPSLSPQVPPDDDGQLLSGWVTARLVAPIFRIIEAIRPAGHPAAHDPQPYAPDRRRRRLLHLLEPLFLLLSRAPVPRADLQVHDHRALHPSRQVFHAQPRLAVCILDDAMVLRNEGAPRGRGGQRLQGLSLAVPTALVLLLLQ
mmetsp:Transcript_133649/g.386908  ORF Transcript_133649/g.386908 Transcript_133649/m.386908 type:complete len:294 (-) Transcript_133649:198-1079(-)